MPATAAEMVSPSDFTMPSMSLTTGSVSVVTTPVKSAPSPSKDTAVIVPVASNAAKVGEESVVRS